MSHIDSLARDFLAQKCIAVAGVSATRKDAANAIYTKLGNNILDALGLWIYAKVNVTGQS